MAQRGNNGWKSCSVNRLWGSVWVENVLQANSWHRWDILAAEETQHRQPMQGNANCCWQQKGLAPPSRLQGHLVPRGPTVIEVVIQEVRLYRKEMTLCQTARLTVDPMTLYNCLFRLINKQPRQCSSLFEQNIKSCSKTFPCESIKLSLSLKCIKRQAYSRHLCKAVLLHISTLS